MPQRCRSKLFHLTSSQPGQRFAADADLASFCWLNPDDFDSHIAQSSDIIANFDQQLLALRDRLFEQQPHARSRYILQVSLKNHRGRGGSQKSNPVSQRESTRSAAVGLTSINSQTTFGHIGVQCRKAQCKKLVSSRLI